MISCSREMQVGGNRSGSTMQIRNIKLRRGLAGKGSPRRLSCGQPVVM
jgi:hypothetical protein